MAISRDVIVAIFLLAATGVLWMASFDIREPDYGQLSPATWPRIILALLTLLSFIFLLQAARAASAAVANIPAQTSDEKNSTVPRSALTPGGFYNYWKNVIWCFVLFGLYLYSLPWLGMLLGALAFVFLLLNALGGWSPHKLALHGVISLITVGGMWSLFTYALGVLLPTGSLFESL